MGGPHQTEFPSHNAQLDRKGQNALEGSVVDLTDYEILETEAGVDLRSWGRIIRKRLLAILIVFFIVLVFGAIATLKQKPMYRAQVVLEVQKENPDIPTIQELYQLES